MMSHSQNGGSDVISRITVQPPGECTCSAVQQRPSVPDL